MNKLNKLEVIFLEKNKSHKESEKDNIGDIKIEKILCNHCGRTATNGIRCLGICVSDNEY